MKRNIEQEIIQKYGDNAQYIMKDVFVKDDIGYIKRHEARTRWDEREREFEYDLAMRHAETAHKCLLTPATAKVGDGATVRYWSDAHACTIIKVTKATVTVRRDKATLDPDFKPEWVAGGFAGRCVNQSEQTYTYEDDPNGEVMTFRWSNKYNSYGTPGNLRLTRGRHEFYDYNF